MRYQCIFFDLDRTLWDLERNNAETLYDLIHLYQLSKYGIEDIASFIDAYNTFNNAFWELYRNGQIEKEELRWKRFHEVLLLFGIDDRNLANRLSKDYINICPLKTGLMPYALETIDYLFNKYPLYIITNGFEEIQHIKLHHCGLASYIKKIITSEQIGFKKPDPRIFEYAVQTANIPVSKCLMIGDEYETDILGAKNVGMDSVFFRNDGHFGNMEATHRIRTLRTLMEIL